MALLAEEVVEEWLNRQGYFTIRGIKLGVHEIDILAIKLLANSSVECRHLEVQASMRPVSFISRVPKRLQKAGKAPNSASRTKEELEQGVHEWIDTKFRRPDKIKLMKTLWDGEWTSELVLNVVKSEEEVDLIKDHGIRVVWLKDIIAALGHEKFLVQSASGADFVDLIQMGNQYERTGR